MEQTKNLLTIDLSVIAEELSDPHEWAFHVQELGFTLYGDTKEEGEDLIAGAINALFNSCGDDHQLFLRYLHSHGVLHRVEQENLPPERESPVEEEPRTDPFLEKAMPLVYSECTELNREIGIFRLREAPVGAPA